MAEPQKRPNAHPSHVGSCSATDCSYNEDRNCNAGEIVVQIDAGQAICGTYTTSAPQARP